MRKILFSTLALILAVISIIFFSLDKKVEETTNKTVKTETELRKTLGPKSITNETKEKSDDSSEIKNLDWTKIEREQPNVIGWIEIPGTTISYPITQGDDNSYYLTHRIDGSYDPLGSIFIDYRNDRNFLDYNTIVYGHNVYDNSPSLKFHELLNFYNEDYFNSHREVLLYTKEKIYKGRTFAIHADSANSESNNIEIKDKEGLKTYADFMVAHSDVKQNDVNTGSIKKMITLWACALKETTDSNGNYTSVDKSRTFLSVKLD